MLKKILIITSTLPANDKDPVPSFVKEQAEWFKRKYSHLEIAVLAPHSAYSKTSKFKKHALFGEYRFHYFWPHRWELLTGKGIMPALRKNKLLYLQLPFLFIFELLAVLRVTKKLKPDLLYAHWFAPQAILTFFVSKLTGIPFVYTTHSSDVIALKKIPFMKTLVWSVCRRASCYTAVSGSTAARLLKVVPKNKAGLIEKKLRIIPMGIELPARVSKVSRNEFMKTYKRREETLVLFIGRLASIKGVDSLIEALSTLKKKEQNFRLLIAGEGTYRKKLEQQVSKLGLDHNVQFLGFVSGNDKNTLINSVDIVCIPSIKEGDHSEGLPVVLMEALATGAQIVASDVSGAKGIIKDGSSGYIFRHGDSEQLAKKLSKAAGSSRATRAAMVARAKSLAKRFYWDRVIQEHYQFINSCLSEKI